MSNDNQIKCIHCESSNTYMFLGNEDPKKRGYMCRECSSSWSSSQLDTKHV